jgi:hypothetical protein
MLDEPSLNEVVAPVLATPQITPAVESMADAPVAQFANNPTGVGQYESFKVPVK